MRLKLDALEVFKIFKAAAENESQKRNDGQRAQVEYGRAEADLRAHVGTIRPESDGVAERTIGVLTNAVRAICTIRACPEPYGQRRKRSDILA